MAERKVKKTALLYGEGKQEVNFFNFLLGTKKFKDIEKDWFINTGHASGSSCKDVLEKCIKATYERSYDIVLCFIDTDKLFHDFPQTYEKQKESLESLAKENGIEIFWQKENFEDVMEIASNGKIKSKSGLLAKLKRHGELVLRSDHVKEIRKYFS